MSTHLRGKNKTALGSKINPVASRRQPLGAKRKDYCVSNINIKDLFVAGAHFGHKTSRWHPKMASNIHGERNGLHIIDLTKTVGALETAMTKISDLVSSGKEILFIGTKQQAKDAIVNLAKTTDMPYVVD